MTIESVPQRKNNPSTDVDARNLRLEMPTLLTGLSVSPHIAAITSGDTKTLATALHAMGLNVTAQPRAQKGGWPWKPLQTARLIESDLIKLIDLAGGDCNLAVVTGRTSGNLLILDCESESEFERQCLAVHRRGIPLWASTSNKPGAGGHIWLRCSQGEIANIAPDNLPEMEMEIRGNRNYFLVPPSLHPEGTFYGFVAVESEEIPLVSLKQLDWLPLTLVAPESKHSAPVAYSPYSRETQDFIASGAPERTRNKRLFSAACDVLGNAGDPYDLLAGSARRSGLSAREIQDTIKSAEKQPRQPSRRGVKQPRPLPWQHGVAYGQKHQWTGRTAITDRSVWAALCERARVFESRGVFRASGREIVELARVTHETAHKAILRLVKNGLLVAAGYDGGRARLVRFGPVVLQTPVTPLQKLETVESDSIAERLAFGVHGLLIWRYLLQHGPHTVLELSAALHLSRWQIHRAVQKLVQVGKDTGLCVIETLTPWIVVSGPITHTTRKARRSQSWQAKTLTQNELDYITSRTGASSKPAERKQKHAQERSTRAFKAIERGIVKANLRKRATNE